MLNKVCPLLLMVNPSNVGRIANCKEDACSWWRDDCCAVSEMAVSITDIQNATEISKEQIWIR